MEPTRPQRIYTRYAFSAAAEIIASDTMTHARVTNISFGGCRLSANTALPIRAKVTIKIHTPADEFEASAQVVHSSATDIGVMWGNIDAQFLFVLQRWIKAAMENFL